MAAGLSDAASLKQQQLQQSTAALITETTEHPDFFFFSFGVCFSPFGRWVTVTKSAAEVTELQTTQKRGPEGELGGKGSYHTPAVDSYYSGVNIDEPFWVARNDSAANKLEMSVAELGVRVQKAARVIIYWS